METDEVISTRARLWANVYLDMSDRPGTADGLMRQDALEKAARRRSLSIHPGSDGDYEDLRVEGTLGECIEIARELYESGYGYALDVGSEEALSHAEGCAGMFCEIELADDL